VRGHGQGQAGTPRPSSSLGGYRALPHCLWPSSAQADVATAFLSSRWTSLAPHCPRNSTLPPAHLAWPNRPIPGRRCACSARVRLGHVMLPLELGRHRPHRTGRAILLACAMRRYAATRAPEPLSPRRRAMGVSGQGATARHRPTQAVLWPPLGPPRSHEACWPAFRCCRGRLRPEQSACRFPCCDRVVSVPWHAIDRTAPLLGCALAG
jgi:hypothetical protein